MSRGLERSGYRDPRTVAVERRADLRVRQLSRGVDALQSAPIASGVLLEGVALTTTPTRTEHGLGRAPVGAFVVAGQAAAFTFVWAADATNPAKYISVSASAGTPTVSLWVF